MTSKIQISKRLDDGTILVLGADTADEFEGVVDSMVSTSGANHIRDLFANFAETDDEIEEVVTRPRRLGDPR